MLSSSNSLLSPGVNKWFHPKPLIEAIDGCVRITAAGFCGSDYLSHQEYKPYGRAKGGHVSIKLTAIRKAYKHYASEQTVADPSVVAGDREDAVWRVTGLPAGLVLLGKSPDSIDCLLSGVDFFYADGAYNFKTNPITIGTLTSRHGEETVDYFYLGGSPAIIDLPQFSFSKYGVQTSGASNLVDSIKSGGPAAFGGVGLLSTAGAGRFATTSSGNIDRVWVEGGCKVGLVANQLIYADKSEKTKNRGDYLAAGDSLVLESDNIGVALIADGKASWVPSVADVVSGIVSHSEVVATNTYKDSGIHKFIADYRPDTANNTIIQPVKVSGGNATELVNVEIAEISKAWILYGNDIDSCNKLMPHTGMVSEEILCHATRSGGCLECHNIKPAISAEGESFIRILSLGCTCHGHQLSFGSSIYAIALELRDGSIYKVINIFPAVTAVAQSTPLIDVYLNKSFEVGEEEPLADDDLSRYWLEVEQDVELFDVSDIL